MKQNESSPGRDLVRSVASEHLAEIVFDAAELALDENLAEGILKEMPIVGSIVRLARAGKSISEAVFVRKLMRFLRELQNVPMEERERLLEEYPDNSEDQQILGENLLLALERLDDIEKPRLLALFFAAYMRGKIDKTTFMRLARSVDRLNLALLPNLRWFYMREEPKVETPEEIIHELSVAGLVTVSLEDSGTINGSANYRRSSLGEDFLRIAFNVEVREN